MDSPHKRSLVDADFKGSPGGGVVGQPPRKKKRPAPVAAALLSSAEDAAAAAVARADVSTHGSNKVMLTTH